MEKRVFLIVLDSFGIGAEPDAAAFGDEGTNTLGAIAKHPNFNCPNLQKLGLFNIDGVTAGDVSVSLELPERYVLGTSPEVYAVYTVNGGDKQESTSVRVPAVLTGLDALLEANAGRELDTASDVKPARTAGMLIAISLACTVAAAGATLCVMRVMRLRKTKKQKPSQH